MGTEKLRRRSVARRCPRPNARSRSASAKGRGGRGPTSTGWRDLSSLPKCHRSPGGVRSLVHTYPVGRGNVGWVKLAPGQSGGKGSRRGSLMSQDRASQVFRGRAGRLRNALGSARRAGAGAGPWYSSPQSISLHRIAIDRRGRWNNNHIHEYGEDHEDDQDHIGLPSRQDVLGLCGSDPLAHPAHSSGG